MRSHQASALGGFHVDGMASHCVGSGHCRSVLRAGRGAELLRIAHQRQSGLRS